MHFESHIGTFKFTIILKCEFKQQQIKKRIKKYIYKFKKLKRIMTVNFDKHSYEKHVKIFIKAQSTFFIA